MSDLPDFYAGGADVILRPEWAVKTGIDKSVGASGENLAFGDVITATYGVPAGKKLTITSVTGGNYPAAAADADKPHTCIMLIAFGSLIKWAIAVDTGGHFNLKRPIETPAGTTFTINLYNEANHNTNAFMRAWGYEE